MAAAWTGRRREREAVVFMGQSPSDWGPPRPAPGTALVCGVKAKEYGDPAAPPCGEGAAGPPGDGCSLRSFQQGNTTLESKVGRLHGLTPVLSLACDSGQGKVDRPGPTSLSNLCSPYLSHSSWRSRRG